MLSKETMAEYRQRYGHGSPAAGPVSVYRIEDFATGSWFPPRRRDFYKVKLLVQAHGVLGYAGRSLAIQQPALIFAHPHMPFSWQRLGGQETGYACLFAEEFVSPQLKTGSVADSPLFRLGGNPVLFPPPEAVGRLSSLFEGLLTETQSTYVHKHDLLRNYLQLILHESQKLLPAGPLGRPGTAAARLGAAFLDLLERQFPLASPQHAVQLKNANEYAQQLAVHTNHLNKAVKETTGKTTTEHIAGKLVTEAKALLRHSDWTLAEISYALGFEHAPNFSSFFKKQTGQPPHRYRVAASAVS